MFNNSLLVEVGKWLLTTGLPWIGGLLLVAPLVAALAERRRRSERKNSRSVAHDLLLSEWSDVAGAIGMSYKYLDNAFCTLEAHELNQKAHDDCAMRMEKQAVPLEEVKLIGRSQTELFAQYTNWLSQAEREFRRCETTGEDLLHQTTILTSVVDPEELVGLLAIRKSVAATIRCARSMVSVIQGARSSRSAAKVPICDHLALNKDIRAFIKTLTADPPTDPWVVRLVDRVLSPHARSMQNIVKLFGIQYYPRSDTQERDDNQQAHDAVVLDIPPKVFLSEERQKEIAQLFLNHPPYLSWIADFARWEEDLQRKQPPEPL